MKDHLVRIIARDGSLRGMAAVTTDLVEETRRRQGTDPTATVALGRLVTGTALLGALLKGGQRLALMAEGNGPLQKLHAETDAGGHLRASVKNPLAGLPPREGRFDVAGAVGRAGFLHVVKDLGLKEPYRGMTQLYTSEIAEDIAFYLTTSEQVPSTVALGVELGPEGEVSMAGGFLIQSMPPRNEEVLLSLEERLRTLPPTTTLLREGLGPLQILEKVFAGIPFERLGETDLTFRCGCSRAQVAQLLKTLGKEELDTMIEEGEGSVTCEYCRETYLFSPGELSGLVG